MDDNFLTRFLSHISKGTLPDLADSKRVSNALIQMHDYGVSFKKVFNLADKRGRKPKNELSTLISDSFQLMSQGFLGNPLFLNRFLSTVDEGKQPKPEDLKLVATALIKMRDDGKSINAAFGITQRTGWKELDVTQLSYTDLVKSEKWAVYYAYKKHIKKQTHENTIDSVSKVSFKKQVKGVNRDIRYSARQIERIVSETRNCFDIYALPIKLNYQKMWKLYFSCKKYLTTKSISEVIAIISVENKCTEWDVCLNLTELYREVVIRKKYVLIT